MDRRLRIALFISSHDGLAILEQFLQPPLEDAALVVGVATDDPRKPFVGANRRFWKYGYTEEERLLVRNRAEAKGIPVWDGRIKPLIGSGGEVLEPSPFPEIFRAVWRPDLAYMSTFGQRIPQALIDVPQHGFFNVHPTSLTDFGDWPRFGGPSPYEDMREAGVDYVTLALHQVTRRFDEGRICCMSARVPLCPSTERKSPENQRMLAVLSEFTGWIVRYHFESEVLPTNRNPQDQPVRFLPPPPTTLWDA